MKWYWWTLIIVVILFISFSLFFKCAVSNTGFVEKLPNFLCGKSDSSEIKNIKL